jgi:hypothetical protein
MKSCSIFYITAGVITVPSLLLTYYVIIDPHKNKLHSIQAGNTRDHDLLQSSLLRLRIHLILRSVILRSVTDMMYVNHYHVAPHLQAAAD